MRFDTQMMAAVHAAATPPLTALMLFFTYLGSVPVLACLCLALILVFRQRGWRPAGLILVLTLLGATALEKSLKVGFRRARPSPYFGIAAPRSFSYPSGHALDSFAFFAMAASLSAPRIRRRWVRGLVWAAAGAAILLIGLSRVYLGVHYPTDVLAGYLVAFIWVITLGLGGRLLAGRAP